MPKFIEKDYEEQYMGIVTEIMREGTLEYNVRTGKSTRRIPHQEIKVDLAKGFPILKTKLVAHNLAIQEIMWIMQKQSNNIKDLGNHLWDKWADENGTIGMAYGSIIKEYKQIDTLIDKIKNDPSDRGMVINLWDLANLHKMNLRPCCLMSIWSVINGTLHCQLIQRSGDMMLGVAFNTTQYAALVYMIAQATGTKPGLLTHTITDAHVYDDQFENTEVQIKRFDMLQNVKAGNNIIIDNQVNAELKLEGLLLPDLKEIIASKPVLWINPEINDFYEIILKDDVKLMHYKHMPKLFFEVAV